MGREKWRGEGFFFSLPHFCTFALMHLCTLYTARKKPSLVIYCNFVSLVLYLEEKKIIKYKKKIHLINDIRLLRIQNFRKLAVLFLEI